MKIHQRITIGNELYYRLAIWWVNTDWYLDDEFADANLMNELEAYDTLFCCSPESK